MSVAGKVVLITGASRGLGAALAFEFAQAGAKVIGVARHAEDLDRAAAALRAHGQHMDTLAIDVAEPDAAVRIAAFAAAVAGPVEVLINNASTLGEVPLRPLLDASDAGMNHTFEVNLFAPLRLIRAVVGHMVLMQNDGLVVNISSDAAVEAYPGWGLYGASKAALDHLTRILHTELAGSGLRFLSVDPGEMDTRMHADAVPEADRAQLARPEAVAQRLVHWLAEDGHLQPSATTITRFANVGGVR